MKTNSSHKESFDPPDDGLFITFSTRTSRKSFSLPLKKTKNYPVAVESFAIDPDYYAELMRKVEKLHESRDK